MKASSLRGCPNFTFIFTTFVSLFLYCTSFVSVLFVFSNNLISLPPVSPTSFLLGRRCFVELLFFLRTALSPSFLLLCHSAFVPTFSYLLANIYLSVVKGFIPLSSVSLPTFAPVPLPLSMTSFIFLIVQWFLFIY